MQKLTHLLSQRQDRDSLPRPEPEVFTRNLLRYPSWIKSFETFIKRIPSNGSINSVNTRQEKPGKPLMVSWPSTTMLNAYDKAKKNHFGNQFIVTDAYRKRINSWPKIQPTGGQGLRKFADFLQHYHTAMHTIQYLNVPDKNQKMIRKLASQVVVR